MIITVEGNIGAGQSSFVKSLCDLLSSRGHAVTLIPEPLDIWTDIGGENMLKLYYENKQRWAFTFQILALASMTTNELKAKELSSDGTTIVIMERSVISTFEIFSRYMSDHVLKPAETEILRKLKTLMPCVLQKDVSTDKTHHLVIYLQTPPDICYERLVKRARTEEIDKIDIAYINELHDLHEKVLIPENVIGRLIILNGSSYKENCIKDAKLVNIYNNNNSLTDILYRIL